ncbi:uroporphyrinogen decarboxylase [soil metagenome]
MKPFPALRNDRILRAARREAVDKIPVWAMRQAGRYLPEFRAVRAEEDFFTVCRTPKLACEVTLQPLRRFELDASIIFSDILVIPQAMGLEVQMIKGKGPHLPEPLRDGADLDRLVVPDVKRDLGYVGEALTLTRHEIGGKVPLIGFAGAPWTLMAYMIEGGGSKQFALCKSWLYADPVASHDLLDRITDAVIEYLAMQIEAGAQLLQVFDSHAGVLSPDAFATFVLPRLKRIASEIKRRYPEIPLIVFARGAHYALDDLAETDYDVIGLDETMPLTDARGIVAGRKAVQGNLDPGVLYAAPEDIQSHTHRMMDALNGEVSPVGFIANLGHGMQPGHTPEGLQAFVDAVHDWEPAA